MADRSVRMLVRHVLQTWYRTAATLTLRWPKRASATLPAVRCVHVAGGASWQYQCLQGQWAAAPHDILEHVGSLLSPEAVAAGRLACAAWRIGLSAGVTSLRPSFAGKSR